MHAFKFNREENMNAFDFNWEENMGTFDFNREKMMKNTPCQGRCLVKEGATPSNNIFLDCCGTNHLVACYYIDVS